MQKAPLVEERKDQKDLQEIAQKVIEACSNVASSSLERTTWLRSNLAVKPGVQQDFSDNDTEGDSELNSILFLLLSEYFEP